MSQPLVSVLMPVHNGQDFLHEAIDSIFRQSYQDFELIVVDDASTDDTPSMLRAMIDPRLRIITMDRNVGLVDALNRALAEARGELIARMDADDIAYPARFSAQVERLLSEPGLVLLGTAYDYVDTGGHVLQHQSVSTENAIIQKRLIEECNQICHPSVMMRAGALRAVGGYRKLAGRYAQDYDLWLRLAEVGAVANLADTFLGYRVHGGQLSVKRLLPQRRAAEIYKALARQRRSCGREDFGAAEREVDASPRALRDAVAADSLHWSYLFFLMGDARKSRGMQLKALWTAPFSATVREMARNGLRGRWRALRGGR